MQSNQGPVFAKLSSLGKFSLSINLVTVWPDPCLVFEGNFLHTVDLRVLYFEPFDFTSNAFIFTVAIFETDFV